jgi:hypothetical protein
MKAMASVTDRAFHLYERLLACTLVTSAVGCARTNKALRHNLGRLSRQIAEPFLGGGDRARCRLTMHKCASAFACGWSRSGFCFERGIYAGLHPVDL